MECFEKMRARLLAALLSSLAPLSAIRAELEHTPPSLDPLAPLTEISIVIGDAEAVRVLTRKTGYGITAHPMLPRTDDGGSRSWHASIPSAELQEAEYEIQVRDRDGGLFISAPYRARTDVETQQANDEGALKRAITESTNQLNKLRRELTALRNQAATQARDEAIALLPTSEAR